MTRFIITKQQLEEQGYKRNNTHGLQGYFTHCRNCDKSTHHRPMVKNLHDFKYVCDDCNCHVTLFLDKEEKKLYNIVEDFNYDYKHLA